MKLHRKKHYNTNLTMRGTLLKNNFSNSVFVGVKVGDSVTLRNHIYIIREEAQSFETHDLRCRACLPNSELAVWWTSVSRWFLV